MGNSEERRSKNIMLAFGFITTPPFKINSIVAILIFSINRGHMGSFAVVLVNVMETNRIDNPYGDAGNCWFVHQKGELDF
jgi:hypothetical protein